MRTSSILMIILGLAFVASIAIYFFSKQERVFYGYNNIPNIWQNNSAVDMQAQGKKTESFDELASLLAEEPFNGIFQYNMGTGFILLEDFAKAMKMMSSLAKNKNLDPKLGYAVNYNMGVLKTLDSKVDEALESYQAALEYHPDSVEVKTNIELLIQQQKSGRGGNQGNPQQQDNQGNQENQEDQKNDQGDKDKEQQQPQRFQNQPQQFKSKDMSPGDVRRILEELKNQEQEIRAKHDRKGGRQKDNDKNW